VRAKLGMPQSKSVKNKKPLMKEKPSKDVCMVVDSQQLK
jgi:hypothetical protein